MRTWRIPLVVDDWCISQPFSYEFAPNSHGKRIIKIGQDTCVVWMNVFMP